MRGSAEGQQSTVLAAGDITLAGGMSDDSSMRGLPAMAALGQNDSKPIDSNTAPPDPKLKLGRFVVVDGPKGLSHDGALHSPSPPPNDGMYSPSSALEPELSTDSASMVHHLFVPQRVTTVETASARTSENVSFDGDTNQSPHFPRPSVVSLHKYVPPSIYRSPRKFCIFIVCKSVWRINVTCTTISNFENPSLCPSLPR